MISRVTATAAARGFSKLLNRVHYRGEEFLIERGGEPVGRLSPVHCSGRTVKDLVHILRSAPVIDAAYLKQTESFRKRQLPLPESPWER